MQDFNESAGGRSFAELFRRFGGGRLFLTGIILYTVAVGINTFIFMPGNLRGMVFLYYDFFSDVLRFVALLLMANFALNATGFWMIFADSKSHELPKMAL